MDDLLTTRQVQEILKVDRITIYRMLQDGRLKGRKIGQQWRFTRQEVEHLLNGALQAEDIGISNVTSGFPTHCVQTIQDLFTSVSQINGLVVDLEGEPLTHPSNPCGFCQLMHQSASGLQACQRSWKEMASQTSPRDPFYTCHAGFNYVAAPIIDGGKPLAVFLAGQFYLQAPEASSADERYRRLASMHKLPTDILLQEGRAMPVLDPSLYTRVETWPFMAARAVQSILNERTGFMQRLQQIANLSQIT
ncbi:MAG: PocR ligand-binding domain-containing protein [Chloroflexi bacterium]|nr:PocR ligand-binding domain-containing protein [Chloroflexota bacterium]